MDPVDGHLIIKIDFKNFMNNFQQINYIILR